MNRISIIQTTRHRTRDGLDADTGRTLRTRSTRGTCGALRTRGTNRTLRTFGTSRTLGTGSTRQTLRTFGTSRTGRTSSTGRTLRAFRTNRALRTRSTCQTLRTFGTSGTSRTLRTLSARCTGRTVRHHISGSGAVCVMDCVGVLQTVGQRTGNGHDTTTGSTAARRQRYSVTTGNAQLITNKRKRLGCTFSSNTIRHHKSRSGTISIMNRIGIL